MLKQSITAGTIILILSACASAPSRVALEPATKQTMTDVEVLSVLAQDEVIVRAPAAGASAALGGGLIGAFIDSKVAESRQNALQATMKPFYSATDDINFGRQFEQALSTTLSNGMPIKTGPIKHTGLNMPASDARMRAQTLPAGKGHMLIRTSYAFTPDFSRLNVNSWVEIRVPANDKPVFVNSFFYQSKPQGAGGEQSVKVWSADKGAAYRAALDEATREITSMLALDLAASATDPASVPKAKLDLIEGAGRKPIEGNVLATNAGRQIIRNTAGNLYSLPQ